MSDLGNKKIMAKNIRHYMAINNVTQTQVCNTLGFKMPTFSDWINAKTYPRIDKIAEKNHLKNMNCLKFMKTKDLE